MKRPSSRRIQRPVSARYSSRGTIFSTPPLSAQEKAHLRCERELASAARPWIPAFLAVCVLAGLTWYFTVLRSNEGLTSISPAFEPAPSGRVIVVTEMDKKVKAPPQARSGSHVQSP